eukprot:TRINITY_DN10980_c0_g1_i1.p1 TRINITY_DN10980_c0_g1~~TRINITY_DN10980_c0_g1_i1.p1  ORF type:complete len:909 (+),score=149.68 TRINITY_DN10980_c0_g1_i1:145-2727(+)
MAVRPAKLLLARLLAFFEGSPSWQLHSAVITAGDPPLLTLTGITRRVTMIKMNEFTGYSKNEASRLVMLYRPKGAVGLQFLNETLYTAWLQFISSRLPMQSPPASLATSQQSLPQARKSFDDKTQARLELEELQEETWFLGKATREEAIALLEAHLHRYPTGVYVVRLSSGEGYALTWMNGKASGHVKIHKVRGTGQVYFAVTQANVHRAASLVELLEHSSSKRIVGQLVPYADPEDSSADLEDSSAIVALNAGDSDRKGTLSSVMSEDSMQPGGVVQVIASAPLNDRPLQLQKSFRQRFDSVVHITDNDLAQLYDDDGGDYSTVRSEAPADASDYLAGTLKLPFPQESTTDHSDLLDTLPHDGSLDDEYDQPRQHQDSVIRYDQPSSTHQDDPVMYAQPANATSERVEYSQPGQASASAAIYSQPTGQSQSLDVYAQPYELTQNGSDQPKDATYDAPRSNETLRLSLVGGPSRYSHLETGNQVMDLSREPYSHLQTGRADSASPEPLDEATLQAMYARPHRDRDATMLTGADNDDDVYAQAMIGSSPSSKRASTAWTDAQTATTTAFPSSNASHASSVRASNTDAHSSLAMSTASNASATATTPVASSNTMQALLSATGVTIDQQLHIKPFTGNGKAKHLLSYMEKDKVKEVQLPQYQTDFTGPNTYLVKTHNVDAVFIVAETDANRSCACTAAGHELDMAMFGSDEKPLLRLHKRPTNTALCCLTSSLLGARTQLHVKLGDSTIGTVSQPWVGNWTRVSGGSTRVRAVGVAYGPSSATSVCFQVQVRFACLLSKLVCCSQLISRAYPMVPSSRSLASHSCSRRIGQLMWYAIELLPRAQMVMSSYVGLVESHACLHAF